MAEPTCFSPTQIDAMTLSQVLLYYDDPDEDMPWEDVIEAVDKYRKEHGIPGPQDKPPE